MVCYLSEVGHKNFHYATQTRALIDRGAILQHLSWVSGSGKDMLQAVKVKKKFIIPLTLDNNYVNTVISNDNYYVVVWIKKGN